MKREHPKEPIQLANGTDVYRSAIVPSYVIRQRGGVVVIADEDIEEFASLFAQLAQIVRDNEKVSGSS